MLLVELVKTLASRLCDCFMAACPCCFQCQIMTVHQPHRQADHRAASRPLAAPHIPVTQAAGGAVAHLDLLHASCLALLALHPQHNLLGGLCLRVRRGAGSAQIASSLRMVATAAMAAPAKQNAHAQAVGSGTMAPNAPSCGRRAWSDHHNRTACGRNASCLQRKANTGHQTLPRRQTHRLAMPRVATQLTPSASRG